MVSRTNARRTQLTAHLLLPLLATALVLSGCGGGGQEEEDQTGGPTTVTAWVSREWSNSSDKFAAFMAAHPDIVVETEVIDTDDILQRMLRAADANQPLPDIIQDDVFTLEAYSDAELVVPINEYVDAFKASAPEEFAKVLPIAWEEPTIDGKIFGVSNAANMDVLYYSVPWFKEAGVELPFDSYDDIYTAAEALKKTRPDEIPLSIQAIAGDGVTGLKTSLIGTGTPFDGATPDLSSPGALYTMDFYQKMQRGGMLPPEAIAWGEAEARGAFVSGAGMIIDGFTTAGDFSDANNFDFGKDWAMTLLPVASGSGQTGARPTSSRTWSVTSGAENPAAAFEVLRYTTTTEFLVPQVLQGGVPPRNSEALESPEVTKFWPFFTPEVKQGFLDSVSAPSALNAGDVEKILEQLWAEIVTGENITPQQLADKYKPQLDALPK